MNKQLCHFCKTETEQVSKFADGKLYSSADASKIISFELKNTYWDATDEVLVNVNYCKFLSNK